MNEFERWAEIASVEPVSGNEKIFRLAMSDPSELVSSLAKLRLNQLGESWPEGVHDSKSQFPQSQFFDGFHGSMQGFQLQIGAYLENYLEREQFDASVLPQADDFERVLFESLFPKNVSLTSS